MLGSRCGPILFHTHSVNIQHMIRYYIDSTIYQNNKLRNHVDCIQLKTITIKELKHKPLETRLEVSLTLIKITSSFTAINLKKKTWRFQDDQLGSIWLSSQFREVGTFIFFLWLLLSVKLTSRSQHFFLLFFYYLKKLCEKLHLLCNIL